MTKLSKEDLASIAYCLMHPARLTILQLLRGTPKRVGEISKATGFSRHLVCYHLSYLETCNLIDSKYVIHKERALLVKRNYASREYRCSPRVDVMIEWIENRLARLKRK